MCSGILKVQLCFKRNETEKLGLRLGIRYSRRRSTLGYCASLSEEGPLSSWKTKQQATVALSSCEAEYMSLASAIQECIYLEQLLKGIDKYQYTKTIVFKDNQGTLDIAKNPVNRQRCKHIDIKDHFIRETVNSLEYCPTEQIIANMMTNPVTKLKLKKFVQGMFGI